MAEERQTYTINSKQNKNKGIIYDGYLLPHFVIKKNAKGDLVINKPKTSAISAEYAEQYKDLIDNIDATEFEEDDMDFLLEKDDPDRVGIIRHNTMSLEEYYDDLVEPILRGRAKQGAKLKKFVSVNYDRDAIADDLYEAMKKEFLKDMKEQKKLLEHSQFNLTPRKGKGDETEFNFNAFKKYQSGIQASYEQSSAKKKLKFAKKKAKVAEAGEKKSKKKAKSAKKELQRVKAETEKTIAQKKEGLEQAKREAAAAMEAQRIENEKALAQKKEAAERTKAQTTKALREGQEALKTIEDKAIKERGEARKRLRGARKKAQEDKAKALEEVNAEKAAALEKAKVDGAKALEKAKSQGEEALKKAQTKQQEEMKQALERARINREAAEQEAEAQASLALAEAQRVAKEALERADIQKAASLEKQKLEAQKILEEQKAKSEATSQEILAQQKAESEAEFARIEAKRKFDLKTSKDKFEAEKKALADANQAEIRGIKTGKKMALDQTKKAAAEALEAQRIENRKALRGARAKGEEEVAKIKEENRARLYRAFEKSIETSASGRAGDVDAVVVGDIIKRYFEEGRSQEETQQAVDALRPPDEQQQKQLVGTEEETMNQPLKPAAVAAVAVDDEEYEAPDSAAAAAAVAPVESSLNTGAGSAAPPPPLPPPPPVPAAVAGGVPPRPRQPFLPVPQVAPVQPPQPPPLVEGQTIKQQGVSPEERSENISLQIKEQEKGDSGTKTDDNLDVSKYGYDKQVSIFAIQEDRDFTYTKEQVKTSTPNLQEGLMDALKMWGYTIEINKPKTNDYEEACEIRTFIFLAKEKYALERRWKKALTELPEALDDIGFSGQETATAATGAGQQMGLITQFADPQVFANFVNQAAAAAGAGQGGGGQGRQPAGQMAGQAAMARASAQSARPSPPSTPYPPNIPLRRTTTEEDLRRVAGELSRQSSAQSAETKSATEGFSTDVEGDGGFETADDSDDFSRRRLTGFGREVGYTNKPDRIQRTERVAKGGQGIQRVRVARPQKAKPRIPKQRRLDTRPKMNVKKAEFKMRRSRINPNLLFTNLTKQNPSLVGTLPLFKTRTTEPNKKVRFLKG